MPTQCGQLFRLFKVSRESGLLHEIPVPVLLKKKKTKNTAAKYIKHVRKLDRCGLWVMRLNMVEGARVLAFYRFGFESALYTSDCNLLSCVLVAQSCPTLCDPLICPWNSLGQNTGVGCYSLLQEIFPTQESNLGLLHCRQILY